MMFSCGPFRYSLPFWALPFLGILSCSPQPSQVSGGGNQSSALSANESNLVGSKAKKKKIDVAKRMITFNVDVINYVDPLTGLTKNILSFDVSGAPDYIAYKICPQDKSAEAPPGGCLQKTTIMNKALLSPLYGGPVSISVRGCVDSADRAVDPAVLCGPWQSKIYQSQLVNEKLATLLREQDTKMEELGNLALDYRKVFQDYVTEAEQCQKSNTKAYDLLQLKLHVIKNIIEEPLHMMKDALLSPFRGVALMDQKGLNVLPAVGQLGNSFLEATADKVCQGQSGEGFCNVMKMFAAQVPVFMEGMNPAATLAPLSSAIIDLTNPDASIARECLAEEKLSRSKAGIQIKKQELQERLKVLQCEISNASGKSKASCAGASAQDTSGSDSTQTGGGEDSTSSSP